MKFHLSISPLPEGGGERKKSGYGLGLFRFLDDETCEYLHPNGEWKAYGPRDLTEAILLDTMEPLIPPTVVTWEST